MSNTSIKSILQSRIQTAHQTSELEMGDTVYQSLFASPTSSVGSSCNIPISKLRSFFTADIGFKPYPPAKLKALAEHMATDGQLERIIVRPIPDRDEYEILAGHNRTAAGRLNGWSTMAAEVIEADDNRATSIAVATNLLRRQDLTIFEKGRAYKALLDAKIALPFPTNSSASKKLLSISFFLLTGVINSGFVKICFKSLFE